MLREWLKLREQLNINLVFLMLPAPCSLFPAPCSLLPTPCSLFPSILY
ncbi:hypothetical protein [Moorena sp. SIO4G3]|nr:hypothetical protein [Moorena sp. SIO4G3]